MFGDGNTARDYTCVADIVDGILACTRKELGYEIFNLGESQTITLNHLIELLETAMNKKAVIDRQPPQPGDVPITFADIGKAWRVLGYQPKVQIEQGILKFRDWFLREAGRPEPFAADSESRIVAPAFAQDANRQGAGVTDPSAPLTAGTRRTGHPFRS